MSTIDTSTVRPELPDPSTAPELFEGVLLRRSMAYIIDLVIIGVIAVAVTIACGIVGFLTLGLAWMAMPIVVPLAVILYYGATLGSFKRATIGMQLMDIVLTPTREQPLDGWMAIIHAVVFWLTIWISWPISLLFALFTPRQQMIHDLIVGTLMLRRSPMVRHWAGRNSRDL